MKLATQIEAIFYIKGRPLSIEEIYAYLYQQGSESSKISAENRALVEDALIELMNDYAHRDSALEISETEAGYSLQLKNEYGYLLKELVPAELGKGALRTLAAVAIKNPILQTELIDLRGSSAYQQVSELVKLGFIRKREQADGRSYWLEVTNKFHQYFEISNMAIS
ncbi:SMC-Scp complex subunit ScpB [Waterburya agarophytonicola K14]|uniref:SMC-Scp complex subunit ScpB n=1 Tax=Waterburya agarophytonicola KI4 TaxID=2874699 RepID=A0A964BSC7_9CYAN|nr:SMC-Scp complex subunit ScpB [Waterburya agarophytonicola]MCC0178575.1 SMC-Scp complex subunit ScpB [Waterburya agarophytonicola KI4]